MGLLPDFPLFIQVGFSFASDWFYHNVGTKFDEITMTDPKSRIAKDLRDHIHLHQLYPKIFTKSPPARGQPSLGIGVVTIPKILGCSIRYSDYLDPHALPLLKPEEDPMSLRVPNLDDNMQWIYSELDTLLDAGFRKDEIGMPNIQGPLNIAFRVIGDNRLLSLIARPAKSAVVEHILDVITEVFIEVTQRLRKALGRPTRSPFTMAGCTYFYLRSSQWEKFELPVLQRCSKLGSISLHHCGLASHEMLESYAKWPWEAVEFGFGTDLKYARPRFISPRLGPLSFSCRISPYRLLRESPDQITIDVNWVIDNVVGGPASISVVGVPWKTPDANIWAMYNAVQAYNRRKAIEDGEDDFAESKDVESKSIAI